MTIRIQGKKWRIHIAPPPQGKRKHIKGKIDGLCHYPSKAVYVKPSTPKEMRSILLHELLHARFPDLDESAVLDFELLYARALKETGL